MTKKGPMSQQELKKREATYIKKYGSAEAVAAKRREWQKKSRENYKGTGGFAGNSELARRAAKKSWEVRRGIRQD